MAVRDENTGMLTGGTIPEIPPYEEIQNEGSTLENLLSMLGGIGQSELGAIWADPTIEQILTANSIKMNPEAPTDIEQAQGVTPEAISQLMSAIGNGYSEAQSIVDTLSEDPSALSEMEDPGPLVTGILESSALGLLGPPGASPVATTPQGIVLPGGAGVTIDFEEIGSISDINLETIFEKLKGYIPGISLPSWLPTAGVIFIPELQDKIRQVDEAIGGVIDSVSGALEGEEDVQGVLDAIGGVIGEVFDAVVYDEEEGEQGIIENAVGSIFDAIKGVLEGTADSSTIGTIIGGVATSVLGTSLPSWLPGVLTTVFTPGSPVISTVQQVLSDMGITLPFAQEEEEIVDINEDDTTLIDDTIKADIKFPEEPEAEEDEVIVQDTVKGGSQMGTDPVGDPIEEFIEPEPEPAPQPEPEPEPAPQPEPEPEPEPGVGFTEEEQSLIRGLFADIIGDASLATTADIATGVTQVLLNAGIIDAEGNVIRPDLQGSIITALTNVGILNENGEFIQQAIPDIQNEVLAALTTAGILDEEGNVIRQEAPDIEGGVISALQTIGLVDADGQLTLDVSGDVLSLLQNAGIVDAEGNVIEQDLTDQFVSTLQQAGVIDEEGASLLATSEDLASLRNELIASGVIGEDVTVASQADLNNLVTALTESGLLGEDTIFATTGDISSLRNDLVAAGLIGEGADVATGTDLANLRNELVAMGLIGEGAVSIDQTVRTALSEFGFTQDQLDQIAGAINIPPNLSGEDIAQLFTDADLSTATNVSDAVTAITGAIDALDVDTTVRTALSEFEFTPDQLDQISGAIDIPANLSGEEITQLFTDANLATATNVTDAVNAINLSLSNLGFATPDNVRDILSEYAFTEAQINQIVNAMPAGLQLTDIDTLIDTALTGVATSEGLQTATTTITDAISGLNFATDANVRTALSEFRFNQDQLDQIAALMPDTLSQNELTLAINASLENVPTNADMDEAFLSITNSLTAGFNAITGEDGVLERQNLMLNAITGLGEGQEQILAGQEGLLGGQRDILTGVGEESQRLEDIIMSSTGLLAAIGAGGLGGGAPARPRPQPYRPYMEKLDYAPGMVEALKPQQQVDYNKEVDRLLTMGMGGRKQGMLV